MQPKLSASVASIALVMLLALVAGCGAEASFFNPTFLNTLTGEYYPLTPGPSAAYVLVRVVNELEEPAEFIVTVDQDVLQRDEDGEFQLNEQNEFIRRQERNTVRLNTSAEGLANDFGTLLPCRESPITRIGLGENLLPTDTAVFVGALAGEAAGTGVAAGTLDPLSSDAGNFECGDTVIFRAVEASGAPGGVVLQSFVLSYRNQPSTFRGPSTFAQLEAFEETQEREDEP